MTNTDRPVLPTTHTTRHRRHANRNRATSEYPFLWFRSLNRVVEPEDAETAWRAGDLDSQTLSSVSPAELLNLLVDLSPDMNRAAWDYCRFFDPGHTITAYRPGFTDELDRQDYPEAQAVIDDFLRNRLPKRTHGGMATVMNRLAMGAFMRGAFFVEFVYDDAGRCVDIATPDPWTARFRVSTDDAGDYWELGQMQGVEFVSLHDYPNIAYAPIDPKPGSPYGRAIALPGVIPALFLLVLIHDIRRIVANQGSPRIDLTVNTEMIRQAFPTLNEAKFKELVDRLTAEALDDMAGLEPDDVFGHPDWLDVGWAEGALSGMNLRGFAEVSQSLEQMLVRGLKSNPLVTGSDVGVPEATSNRWWEIFNETIHALQRKAKDILERQFELMIRAEAGLQAAVVIDFASIRASEEMRDAQTLQVKLANARAAEQAGYFDHDEASEYAVGHKAKGAREAVPPDQPAGDMAQTTGNLDGAEAIDADMVDTQRRREVREVPPFVPTQPTGDQSPNMLPTALALDRAALLYDAIFPDHAGVLAAVVAGEGDQ
jgi:hypothetical protein